MKVPLLDLKKQYFSLKKEMDLALKEVIESQYFILGPVVEEFEHKFASYCGASHAVGCSSGSDAILLSLMAMDVGPGDFVLCPSFTFYSTASSITRLGACPIFVDICPHTYNMSLSETRKILDRVKDKQTLLFEDSQGLKGCIKALLPVHLFGQSLDMKAWSDLSIEFGVPIIEDCAQSVGARDMFENISGSKGDMGCFSFFPSKNLGCFGDGGAVVTNSQDLADRLKRLRVHGMHPKYEHQEIGINGRLDSLQAAVLNVKMKYLDSWHEMRCRNADNYDRYFSEAGAIGKSNEILTDGIPLKIPSRPLRPARHVVNQYVIRVPEGLRDSLRDFLHQKNIGCEIYYKIPLHLQRCFEFMGHSEGSYPHTENASREVLALPIYPELTAGEQEYVALSVIHFLKEHKNKFKFDSKFEFLKQKAEFV